MIEMDEGAHYLRRNRTSAACVTDFQLEFDLFQYAV